MAIFKSARVTELESQVETLTADLATSNALAQSNAEAAAASATSAARITELEGENLKLTEANGEIEGLNATISAQNAEIAGLKEAVKITDTKISAAAATKLAAMGHQEPLDVTGASVAADKATEIKSLTGLAKVTAAFKASSNK